VFRFPIQPSILYVKRVIASGGSTVSIEKCVAIVDGKPLTEPYVAAPSAEFSPQCNYRETAVPNGQYFVLNDNRSLETDSRLWGFVPQENFIATFGE
jgi:signal peptidase I